MGECKVNWHIYNIIENWLLSKKSNAVILFLTSREDTSRHITTKWIEDNLGSLVVSNSHLIMRNTGDRRPSAIVKKELYNKYIRDGYNVEFVLDDDKSVIDMFHKLGLNCLQVIAKTAYLD